MHQSVSKSQDPQRFNWDSFEQIRGNLSSQTKFFLIGEEHDLISHKLLQTQLISHLAKERLGHIALFFEGEKAMQPIRDDEHVIKDLLKIPHDIQSSISLFGWDIEWPEGMISSAEHQKVLERAKNEHAELMSGMECVREFVKAGKVQEAISKLENLVTFEKNFRADEEIMTNCRKLTLATFSARTESMAQVIETCRKSADFSNKTVILIAGKAHVQECGTDLRFGLDQLHKTLDKVTDFVILVPKTSAQKTKDDEKQLAAGILKSN